MLSNIANNKVVLEYCVKLASKSVKSNNTTDIFKALVKLAADHKIVFDSLQAKIDDIISMTNGNPEYIKSFLKQNSFTISKALNSMPGSDLGKSNAYSFILGIDKEASRERWLEYTTQKLLEGEPLISTIANLISQGMKIENLSTQTGKSSLDQARDDYNFEVGVEDTYNLDDESAVSDSSTEEEASKLEEIFSSIMSDPSQDLLSLYVENTLYPVFSELKTELSQAKNTSQYAEVEQKLREFYNFAVDYIKVQFSSKKRIPGAGGGVREDFSLLDVQTKVDEALGNLDLDSLVDKITDNNFYILPKELRRSLETHPDLIKEFIKSMIKSLMIITTKDELGVSLPNVSFSRNQAGKAKMGLPELLRHIINKRIRALFKDENTQEEYMHKILAILKAKQDSSGKWQYGSGRNFLDYSLFQHATPLTYASIISKFADELGDKFDSLDDQGKDKIVDYIYSKVHPHMPHAEYGDKYFNKVNNVKNIGEEAVKKHIRERIEAAQRIHRGELNKGKLLHPPIKDISSISDMENPYTISDSFTGDYSIEDSFRESALSAMIKKYAFKNNFIS